jgi:predicted transposase YdaD
MEAYHKSVTEYDDVILAVNYAEEKGEKRGEKRGRKKGIEIGEKRGVEIGEKRGVEIGKKSIIEGIVQNSHKLSMSIKQIAELTGLTEEQIFVILDKQTR